VRKPVAGPRPGQYVAKRPFPLASASSRPGRGSVLVACWSVKGGSGTTVVATALALVLARAAPSGVLLVDLGGDVPVALGVPEPDAPGVGDWLAAAVEDDALERLTVDTGGPVRLLARGASAHMAAGAGGRAGERLAAALHAHPASMVVVDCGPPGTAVGTAVAGAAPVSLLVMRPCFLALRRAVDAPLRPSSVVLVAEPGHRLRDRDITAALGVPVGARVPWDPAVARTVDRGILAHGLPRGLERALREAA
jgi:hypothetical protein